jgi:hypothetical protein
MFRNCGVRPCNLFKINTFGLGTVTCFANYGNRPHSDSNSGQFFGLSTLLKYLPGLKKNKLPNLFFRSRAITEHTHTHTHTQRFKAGNSQDYSQVGQQAVCLYRSSKSISFYTLAWLRNLQFIHPGLRQILCPENHHWSNKSRDFTKHKVFLSLEVNVEKRNILEIMQDHSPHKFNDMLSQWDSIVTWKI